MVADAEKDRVRALVADTITLLCKNGLSYKAEFSIEALIGITLDKNDIMLININETVKTAEALQAEERSPSPKNRPISPQRRKRKKRRSSTPVDEVIDSKRGLVDVVAQQEQSTPQTHSIDSPRAPGTGRGDTSAISRNQNNVPSLSLTDMQEDSANLWSMDMGDGEGGEGGVGTGNNGLKSQNASHLEEEHESDISDSECVVIKSEEGSGEDSNISGVFPSQFFQGDQSFGGSTQQMAQGEGAMWDMSAAGTSATGGDEVTPLESSPKKALQAEPLLPPGSGSMACPLCGKQFIQRYNVKRHILTAHLPKPSEGKCPFCTTHCSRMDHLYRHLKTNHGLVVERGKNQCMFCEDVIQGAKTYMEHLNDDHKAEIVAIATTSAMGAIATTSVS